MRQLDDTRMEPGQEPHTYLVKLVQPVDEVPVIGETVSYIRPNLYSKV